MVPQRTKSSSRKREAAAQIKGSMQKKSNIGISSTLGHVHGIDKNNMDLAMGKNTGPPFLGSVSQRKHSHDTAEIRENIKNFFGSDLSVTTCDPKIGLNESKGGQRGDSQNYGAQNFPASNGLGVPINYMGHLMTEKSLLEETRLLQNMYLASSNYLSYLIRNERTPHHNHTNSSTDDLIFSEKEPQTEDSSPIQEQYPDLDKHSNHEEDQEEEEEHENENDENHQNHQNHQNHEVQNYEQVQNDDEVQNDEEDQNDQNDEKQEESAEEEEEENERPVSTPEPRRLRSRNSRESDSRSVSSKTRSSEAAESSPISPRKTRSRNSDITNREIPSSDMDDETRDARPRTRETHNRKHVNEDQNEEVSIRTFALLRGNTPVPSSPKENSEPRNVETLQNSATEPEPLPKLKKYQCPVCRKISVDKRALLRHSKIHTRDSPIECDICHKKLASEETLGKHMQRHTGEKPFGCPYCEKCFTVKHHLKFHLRKHRSW